MYNIFKKKVEKNSLLLSIVFSINLITFCLPEKVKFDNIMVIFVGIILILALYFNKFKFKIGTIEIIIFILIIYLISFLKIGIRNENLFYLLNFLFFGISGLYLSQISINIKSFYKYCFIIQLLCMPKIIFQDFNILRDNWMGVSYAMLPSLITNLIYIFTINKSKFITIISSITFSLYIYRIIPIASRGVIIALFIFLFGLILLSRVKSIGKRVVILASFLGVIYIGSIYYLNLIKIINSYLASKGVYIRFLEKIILLSNNNNLLNGREVLYKAAINGINKNPILGNGIGAYEIDTGFIYAHNIFLQVWYEMGIIMVLILIFLILYILIKIFLDKKVKKENQIFWFCIFCSCIFKLLVSSVYWREPRFWILLGVIINIIKNNKFKYKNNKLRRIF